MSICLNQRTYRCRTRTIAILPIFKKTVPILWSRVCLREEVTPDGLIAIGQIAKRYQLYSKITGGQRVDLFGARLEQLPDIWRELVAAGFETGHAYGKSLRTVKSCVGSTWCRYGVQDSTAMAVMLENRYKGLRAPHKIKMAVSGCTRECAEAQSKDVGVIATDKGWNLYLCGNGGMKPRHADLFASDLDDTALMRTIDRFLMFYIRTADRLQRTSTWMDNLEGGIAYLREVILDDSLGIASELEQEMARVVESYQCEWQTTLSSPQRLALFRSYINSDEADETVAVRLYAGNRSWLNLHPGVVSHYRQNLGRRYAPLMLSLSRRVLAHVWEMCKLHYSALGRRFMPLITLNPVALRRCYRAVFWGMCRVSRLLSRRCINNVFVCAMAASMTAENRRYAPGR